MDEVEASVVVHLPPEEVYELLFEYTDYPQYTPHLDDVTIRGDGPGTRLSLSFSWWKLSYTARCRVTDVERPTRIEWEAVDGIDARGRWRIEPVPDLAPEGIETASRARLRVAFDRENSRIRGLRLPPLVSVEWVLERITPLVRRECEKLAGNVVADVEGGSRPVELSIHARPDSV